MKKIKYKIKSFLVNNTKKSVLLIVCVFAVTATLILMPNARDGSGEDFLVALNEYNVLAGEHELITNIPGMEDNPVRQELDQILSRVLTESMSPDPMLEMSKNGMKLVELSEEQIDNIGDMNILVDTSIKELEKVAGEINNKDERENAQEIIEMAKERRAIIDDIKGVSYRTSYNIAEIFKRIISDNGKLTDAHIIDLNNQIPEAEKQFDKRSALYGELTNLSNKMEKKYLDFEKSL